MPSPRPSLQEYKTPFLIRLITHLGPMAVACNGGLIEKIWMPHPSGSALDAAITRSFAARYPLVQKTELAAELSRYFRGERRELHYAVNDEYLSTFGKKVMGALHTIAWGKTATYGELATAAGSPSASRAVGRVMAKNRTPLVLPCHRIIAATGAVGGYSAAGGSSMKEGLLTLEGSL